MTTWLRGVFETRNRHAVFETGPDRSKRAKRTVPKACEGCGEPTPPARFGAHKWCTDCKITRRNAQRAANARRRAAKNRAGGTTP